MQVDCDNNNNNNEPCRNFKSKLLTFEIVVPICKKCNNKNCSSTILRYLPSDVNIRVNHKTSQMYHYVKKSRDSNACNLHRWNMLTSMMESLKTNFE